ncbi:hypothetical protein FHS95_001848 [Sphingomonas naasensis]|uniref:DUF3108 domain-containing protein n=1 Tax=Sphingomonas naasensis TaxID=1344951 RepID=A0A4S1WQB6_9SPHN|nr:hypothetical protein [Sphingomonas naasensis]NIJ20156.1 hypothetical protein [Sphingomonas naasensis]TGX44307.1 hypothetical protein E5A74_05760 [Sphingomonas naasensis]
MGWRIAALAVVLVVATPAAAEMNCYAPQWQRLTDAKLGVSAEVSTDTHVSYGFDQGYVNVTVDERMRPGAKTAERCSSFNFNVTDFAPDEVSDAQGLLKMRADEIARGGLNNFRLIRNRALTFQGSPAREVAFSFTIDYFGTPASHRYLIVMRNNRLYTFGWVWGDAGAAPGDSNRIFDSIRFSAPVADANARSRAMLEETILLYWLRKDYPKTLWMSPALLRIADPKRAAESKIVDGYGYVQKVDFLGTQGSYRVFRVEHSNAVVDWFVIDDGKQISALTWKKVRDIAR